MNLKDKIEIAVREQGGLQAGAAEDVSEVTSLRSLQGKLSAAFANLEVSELPKLLSGGVITIPSNATIAEVVQTLSKHNILSAPVCQVDAPNGAKWQERYLGLVDFAGVVLWVLKEAEVMATAITASAAGAGELAMGVTGAFGAMALGVASLGVLAGVAAGAVTAGAVAGGVIAARTAGKSGVAAVEALGDDFFKLLHESEVYKKTKVSELAATYLWTQFQPVKASSSLYDLFLLLSKYELKRVPVIDEHTGQAANFITQSAVIRWFHECRGTGWFEAVAERKLEDVGLPVMSPLEVVSVTVDTPVLNAFQLMHDKRISGVPIMRDARIVGNISLKDIRFLLASPDLFQHGREPTVGDLMEKAQYANGRPDDVDRLRPVMSPPITCTSNETLKDVIALLEENNVHRVYVTSCDQQVLGVISPRDIVACFLQVPEGEESHFALAWETISITMYASRNL